jgi:ABC-type multidrug transport system ATPase subunit
MGQISLEEDGPKMADVTYQHEQDARRSPGEEREDMLDIKTFSFVNLSLQVTPRTVSQPRLASNLLRRRKRQEDIERGRSNNGPPGGPPGASPQLTILDNVSGELKCGEMMALMGPSGSGKTSLLGVLAQRIPSRNVKGEVYINGRVLKKKWLKRSMGFVFQDDLLLWNLTVRETILFAAKLRLPQSMPMAEKEDRVDALIERLGISGVKDSIIGKESKRGVSGGERKRVGVAIELVTSPQLLFW